MFLTLTEVRDAIDMAIDHCEIEQVPLRSDHTGVMIGVASVIAMASVIDGLDRAAVRRSINSAPM